MQTESHNTLRLNKGPVSYFLGILPFIIVHSVSAMFFQLRNVQPEHFNVSAAGFFSGLFFASAVLYFLERSTLRNETTTAALRAVVLLLLLAPPIFSIYFQIATGGMYSGSTLTNAVQPFLWALLVPFAFYFFFHPVLEGFHCIFFGLATAIGHLCWALLVPIISRLAMSSHALAGAVETIYLPFLNVTRSFFAVIFAFALYSLTGFVTATLAGSSPSRAAPQSASLVSSRFSARPLWAFMLPLAVYFFLYGMLEHRLYKKFAVFMVYAEYMHLGLAVFYLYIGFLISRRGENTLRTLLVAALLGSAANMFLFQFIYSSAYLYGVDFLFRFTHRVLVFASLLAGGLFALRTGQRILGGCILLSGVSLSILGDLLDRYLTASSLALPSSFLLVLLGVVCIACVPCVYRFFPLPAPDELLAQQTPVASEAGLTMDEQIEKFSKLHKLSKRESQILQMLLQGLSSGEMATTMQLKENSIRTYTQSLLKKTGSNSRLSLVAAVLGHGKEQGEKNQTTVLPALAKNLKNDGNMT